MFENRAVLLKSALQSFSLMLESDDDAIVRNTLIVLAKVL